MSAPAELCYDSWPLITCQGSNSCSHLDNLNPDVKEIFEHAAIEYLWRWSGRRFGLCEVSLRPCAEDCTQFSTWRGWSGAVPGYYGSVAGMYPVISGGNWFNIICGRCNKQKCGCDEISTIVLPGPVNEILDVLIDGEPLDPAAYRLDNLGLSRIDGESWPKCQNMANDPTGESPEGDSSDTFMVIYSQGVPVPAAGRLAAGILACELAKESCNDSKCRLPRRAQTVSREGVTITLPNDDAFFTNGVTGIMEIDMFLSATRAENRSQYQVRSPDLKQYRRQW